VPLMEEGQVLGIGRRCWGEVRESLNRVFCYAE